MKNLDSMHNNIHYPTYNIQHPIKFLMYNSFFNNGITGKERQNMYANQYPLFCCNSVNIHNKDLKF